MSDFLRKLFSFGSGEGVDAFLSQLFQPTPTEKVSVRKLTEDEINTLKEFGKKEETLRVEMMSLIDKIKLVDAKVKVLALEMRNCQSEMLKGVPDYQNKEFNFDVNDTGYLYEVIKKERNNG